MIGGLDGMGLVECPIDFQSIHLEVGEIGPITVRYEVPVEPIENLEVVTSVRNFFLNVVSHVEQEVQRYYIRKAVDNARHKWCARTLSLKQGNKHFLEKLEQLGIGEIVRISQGIKVLSWNVRGLGMLSKKKVDVQARPSFGMFSHVVLGFVGFFFHVVNASYASCEILEQI
ncbi:hypothetical protein V6N11_042981 [Hibiscus sabdariffa]|uniref:Uncharacterized protein n=1 Tax=Hibiscus sabdariffa TaxID=183260 RepID=A0ABR2QY58_9ROSI